MIIDSYKFASAPPLDADAAAYIARFTVPPSGEMTTKINTFFLTLKSIGAWSKLDMLFLSKGVQDSQVCLLDLKRPTKVAAGAGSNWSFDSGLGWVTGQYTYTATDYQPGFNGVNLQRDDNCIFAYLTQKPQVSDGGSVHRLITQWTEQFLLQVHDTTGDFTAAYINGASVTAGAGIVTSGALYALRRDSSTSASITKDTAVVASSATASNAIPASDNSINVLRAGDTANKAIATPQGIGAFGAGAFLTTTELGNLKTALETFWS